MEHKPERDVVRVKHLCNTQELSSVLLDWVQNHHLQHTHVDISDKDSDIWLDKGWISQAGSYQIVEVLADLPNYSGEGRSEQLLHIVGPRAVPVVCLQVVNPLKK